MQTARKRLGGRCLYEVISFEFVFKSNFTISLNVFLPRKAGPEMPANEKVRWGGDGELLVSANEQPLFETVCLLVTSSFCTHMILFTTEEVSFIGEQMCIPVYLPY